MSVQSRVTTMRSSLASTTDPAAFLTAVLSATGQTLSAGEQAVMVLTRTREQIMLRFATKAEM